MFLFKPIRFHRLFDIRKELFWFYHSFPLLRGNLTLKYLIRNGLDSGLWMSPIKCWCLIWLRKKKVSLRQVRDQLNMTTIISRLRLSLLAFFRVIRRFDIKINYNILPDLGITCYRGFSEPQNHKSTCENIHKTNFNSIGTRCPPPGTQDKFHRTVFDNSCS